MRPYAVCNTDIIGRKKFWFLADFWLIFGMFSFFEISKTQKNDFKKEKLRPQGERNKDVKHSENEKLATHNNTCENKSS